MDIDQDDRQVGLMLTRREALVLLGAGGTAAILAACPPGAASSATGAGSAVTDANGLATFTTVYPGWYQGRTVHIHFKIRADAAAASGLEFTSQLFFDDTLTDQVHSVVPHAQKGRRTLRNDGDVIYATGGDELLLDVSGDASLGNTTTFPIGLQVA